MNHRVFQPIRLTDDQKKDPKNVIESFISDIHFDEIRKGLWECLEVSLTSENNYFETPQQREWIIYFYKRLEQFLEASYLLKSREK